VTKPNPENCKNCSSKCTYDCAQLSYAIQHRTVLIISPLTSRQTPWPEEARDLDPPNPNKGDQRDSYKSVIVGTPLDCGGYCLNHGEKYVGIFGPPRHRLPAQPECTAKQQLKLNAKKHYTVPTFTLHKLLVQALVGNTVKKCTTLWDYYSCSI